jgi:molybdopterin-guanine dinucleotide biosynthesis protein A
VTRVAAVILAGGRGERMGGANKALLELAGRSFLDRARDAVVGSDPVLLSVGGNAISAEGMRCVPDLAADYAGPLAGLAAAVDALLGSDVEALLSLAVDTPFFPHDFLARAVAVFGGIEAVIGAYGDQDYPTNALWRLPAIAALPDMVRAGTAPHSLKRLAGGLNSVRLDYRPHAAEDPFLNANTPEDLENLAARARRHGAG